MWLVVAGEPGLGSTSSSALGAWVCKAANGFHRVP